MTFNKFFFEIAYILQEVKDILVLVQLLLGELSARQWHPRVFDSDQQVSQLGRQFYLVHWKFPWPKLYKARPLNANHPVSNTILIIPSNVCHLIKFLIDPIYHFLQLSRQFYLVLIENCHEKNYPNCGVDDYWLVPSDVPIDY